MMAAPTSRVVMPHDVPQTCCTDLSSLERDVERFRKILPEVVRGTGLQRPAVTHECLNRVGAKSAGEIRFRLIS